MDAWLDWIRRHADLLGLALSVVGLLVAAVSPARKAIPLVLDRLLIWLGHTRRRYARWFLGEYGTLRNIYLDHVEELSLERTYVPLSIFEQDDEDRRFAAIVLGDRSAKQIVVVGEPGSGKSTLLKAFGTGLLRTARGKDASSTIKFGQTKEVPFFVGLRFLAKYLEEKPGRTLAGYLVEEVLERHAGVRRHGDRPGGERFLRRLLLKDRCLVLLDGLDEVRDASYQSVREAILEFAHGQSADLPTKRARIVLTCRTQNFQRLMDDWIPVFVTAQYTLAPLRDDEMHRFIQRRSDEFTEGRTPDAFFAMVMSSPTADWHRVPLILTVSLGMYLQRPAYQIPRSVTAFYETMVKELLQRHDFRLDRTIVTRGNQFASHDKYPFLCELALAMATRPGEFADFGYQELADFAEVAIRRFAHVKQSDVPAFLTEIIDHSGLLSKSTGGHGLGAAGDVFQFAHLSVHEFLAAEELARDPGEGAAFLLERAEDRLWRGVISFYVSRGPAKVEAFVLELAKRNLELAGHCLGSAERIDDSPAEAIINELTRHIRAGGDVSPYLAALASAAVSPKERIRRAATDALVDLLTSLRQRGDLDLLAQDTKTVVRLLDRLVAMGPQTAVLVRDLVPLVPRDDPDQIKLCWKALSAIDPTDPAGRATAVLLVDRLLEAAMKEEGFAELQRQPAFTPGFVTDEVRERVYPFKRGVGQHSNLVTLLAWADRLQLTPSRQNRFLEAASSDQDSFRGIERDRRRRQATISVNLLYVGWAITTGAIVGAVGVIGPTLYRESWRSLLIAPDVPFWHNAWYLLPGIAAPLLLHVLLVKAGDKAHSRHTRLLYLSKADSFVSVIDKALPGDGLLLRLWATTIISMPHTVALHVLLPTWPLASILTLSTLVVWVTIWLPATELFDNKPLYLRSRNPFVDVYDDPRSRHWVSPETG